MTEVPGVFEVCRCDPEATFDVAPLYDGDAPLSIQIAAAGGGTVGNAYASNAWLYEVHLAGTRVCAGDDLYSGYVPHTHVEMAAVLAAHLADLDEVTALHDQRERLDTWADLATAYGAEDSPDPDEGGGW